MTAQSQPENVRLGEDGESVVLLFSTEGDTDPDHYRQVLCD